jgi:hypothetical protein
MNEPKCAKCGNPDIYKSWDSVFREGKTALCRICFEDLFSDMLIVRKELELCERCRDEI